jgi:hypothetical protein
VKFRLAGDEASGFSVAGWKLERVQVSCASFDTLSATNKTLSEQPSNAFRYDSTADQYVNNVSFIDKAVGTCWPDKGDAQRFAVVDFV